MGEGNWIRGVGTGQAESLNTGSLCDLVWLCHKLTSLRGRPRLCRHWWYKARFYVILNDYNT